MLATAATGPSAYWYLTRGTGTITLILLTLSVALGVANVRRVRTDAIPRFVLDAVHRNASLLALAFLIVHIATALLDGFAPIRLIDVIVPFQATYRPLWLGFGAVAFDLMVAVALTSVLRRRLGYRAWRATHWAAYACWPVALLHGLGTGSDAKTTWMLAITGACVVVVIVAVVARATAGWPEHPGARATALLASAMVPLGLLIWLPGGPLAAGWAKRAGTPNSLLPRASTGASSGTGGASASAAPSFTAQLSGTVREGRVDNGLAEVHLMLTAAGQHLRTLGIRIIGQPIDGGGVQMTRSKVALGPESSPELYTGTVTALEGTNISATVSDSSGSRLTLVAQLQIDATGGTASGTLSVTPAPGR